MLKFPRFGDSLTFRNWCLCLRLLCFIKQVACSRKNWLAALFWVGLDLAGGSEGELHIAIGSSAPARCQRGSELGPHPLYQPFYRGWVRSKAKWGASIRAARDDARFSNPEIPFLMLRKKHFFRWNCGGLILLLLKRRRIEGEKQIERLIKI